MSERRIQLRKWCSSTCFTYFSLHEILASADLSKISICHVPFVFAAEESKATLLQENTDSGAQMLNAKPHPMLLLWQVYSTKGKIYLKESGFIKPNHFFLICGGDAGSGGWTSEHIRRGFFFSTGCIWITLWNGPPLGMKTNEAKKQGEKQLISCKHKYDGSPLEMKVERSFQAPAVLCALGNKAEVMLCERASLFLPVEEPHMLLSIY